MSLVGEASTVEQPATAQLPRPSWTLWRRQIAAILGLEIKKNFWGRRAILMYLLAAFPVFIFIALTQFDDRAAIDISQNWGEAKIILANIFEGLILRTVVFFGCAWIFMNLFRGEIVDKSLHYYFLAPLRREVLVAGKYISGLVASGVLFGLSTAGSLFFIYLARGYPANVEDLLSGVGGKEALAYLSITWLACLGYGAFFLVIGLFFRNPIIPALVAYGWEWINFLLPPVLKKISIIHYLHSLMPVPVSEGPFAMVADPTPAWIAVPGMLLTVAVVMILAGYRIRRMEIRYGNE
jgi:ABC-type transport system involved in multi-copper enzyme maturation permease subunit